MPELPRVASAGARHGGTGARVCAWLRWQCPCLEGQGGLRAVSVMSPGVPRAQEGQFGPKAWGQGTGPRGSHVRALGAWQGVHVAGVGGRPDLLGYNYCPKRPRISRPFFVPNSQGLFLPPLRARATCLGLAGELGCARSWLGGRADAPKDRSASVAGEHVGGTMHGGCTLGTTHQGPRAGAGCRGPRAENHVLSP